MFFLSSSLGEYHRVGLRVRRNAPLLYLEGWFDTRALAITQPFLLVPQHSYPSATGLAYNVAYRCSESVLNAWKHREKTYDCTTEIGVALTTFGGLFMMLGVMLFFDGALLALGNVRRLPVSQK
jgi:hypothetical protein